MHKEVYVLDAVLNFLIPGDSSRKLPPGAQLFDKQSFLGNLPPWYKQGLLKLNEESHQKFSKDFSELERSEQQELLSTQQKKFAILLSSLMIPLVEQYYQNGHVLEGIGYGNRAPFPDGFHIIEGDLTLLENVYLKGPIYKDV